MKRIKLILLFIGMVLVGGAVYLFFISPNDATNYYPYYHMPYMMYDYQPNYYLGIFIIVFIILIVGLLFFLLKSPKDNNMDTLNRRLALGEISIEEYNNIKQYLQRK